MVVSDKSRSQKITTTREAYLSTLSEFLSESSLTNNRTVSSVLWQKQACLSKPLFIPLFWINQLPGERSLQCLVSLGTCQGYI